MRGLFQSYLNIPRPIYMLIGAEVCVQLVNAVFTLLLNFYMQQNGYHDYEITSITSNRYLTVLMFSLPLALYIKGKSLKKFMMAGALLTPLTGLAILWAIHIHNDELIRWLMALWGISFSLLQIVAMPYALLNSGEETRTESITLFFQTGIITTIVTGAAAYLLINTWKLTNETGLLLGFTLLGLFGVLFIARLPKKENIPASIPAKKILSEYDWWRIFRAVFPTFLIAFGAGFTIPFINLFFQIVHGMNAGAFSLMNAVAFTLVFTGNFLIPAVKKRFGYTFAITFIQSAAVLLLFLMGASEWWAPSAFAYWMAALTFIFRQPLMNIAGPMTSELTLSYVGEKNREIISALNAAIWSGAWFGSARIFAILRQSQINYSNIIFITVTLYIAGVLWYHHLIRIHEAEIKKAGH